MHVSPADEQLTAALNDRIIKCSVTRCSLVSHNYAVPTTLLAAASLVVDQVRNCMSEIYQFGLILLYCCSCLKTTTLVGRAVRSATCSARCSMPVGKYVIAKMRGLASFAPSAVTSSYLLTTTALSGPLCELTVFCQIIE